jgi:hypothetical protein
MHDAAIQALPSANRPARAAPAKPRLVIAGATGALGNAVLRQLVGLQQFGPATVLAREPIVAGLHGVSALQVPEDPPAAWPAATFEAGIVLFDPPRLFYDRERALWTPRPKQLLDLARWMRSSGVATLAVVLPHPQASLPEALRRGLATLEEHLVAALGFERLLFIRSAYKPVTPAELGLLPRLAHWMLSIVRFMVPTSEQPVRSVKVAQFLACALQFAPPGIHVAPSELVWHAAQGDMATVVGQWLRR